jgi:hypothetical protein
MRKGSNYQQGKIKMKLIEKLILEFHEGQQEIIRSQRAANELRTDNSALLAQIAAAESRMETYRQVNQKLCSHIEGYIKAQNKNIENFDIRMLTLYTPGEF